ncbi:2'-5' RNA ligase family protein [Bradyrhizobium guangzhouense]|uniref:2'-5' RNA ligase family protein n=1 Tax=Bradyrhizobium guangzhouense TaxID=1325095 RepID=A0AAE5X7F4_9BRAD|nr:2'-5' RNA ligase family protein [Bradyrhizobium guangzhouense]QAU49949.1 2'-5' RNA ligase family protein [Bradyrhizobium guangzhouense]RXH10095.1 2'-5' RNA ligase family protein [Bradyrhizobium guangzhouense]
MAATFILTAELDPASFAWLDGLRRNYFPPERNLLPAHLTLFHRLSSEQTGRLREVRLPRGPIRVLLDAPLPLGPGVAIRVRSPDLEQVRSAARLAMGGEFSRQDSQGWRPHVTIQNKVAADVAKRLRQQLATDFEPRAGAATALLVWEYLNGPWKPVDRLPF